MRHTPSSLVVTTLRLERSDLDKLRDIAGREERTVSQEMRRLVKERIAADEQEKA